jgi:hypothetical protein
MDDKILLSKERFLALNRAVLPPGIHPLTMLDIGRSICGKAPLDKLSYNDSSTTVLYALPHIVTTRETTQETHMKLPQ